MTKKSGCDWLLLNHTAVGLNPPQPAVSSSESLQRGRRSVEGLRVRRQHRSEVEGWDALVSVRGVTSYSGGRSFVFPVC